ncbi:MAG: hypothetical protein ACKVLN_01595 [Rhodobacterales bacterium]
MPGVWGASERNRYTSAAFGLRPTQRRQIAMGYLCGEPGVPNGIGSKTRHPKALMTDAKQ